MANSLSVVPDALCPISFFASSQTASKLALTNEQMSTCRFQKMYFTSLNTPHYFQSGNSRNGDRPIKCQMFTFGPAARTEPAYLCTVPSRLFSPTLVAEATPGSSSVSAALMALLDRMTELLPPEPSARSVPLTSSVLEKVLSPTMFLRKKS